MHAPATKKRERMTVFLCLRQGNGSSRTKRAEGTISTSGHENSKHKHKCTSFPNFKKCHGGGSTVAKETDSPQRQTQGLPRLPSKIPWRHRRLLCRPGPPVFAASKHNMFIYPCCSFIFVVASIPLLLFVGSVTGSVLWRVQYWVNECYLEHVIPFRFSSLNLPRSMVFDTAAPGKS